MGGRRLTVLVEGRLLRRAKCMYLSFAVEGRKVMAARVNEVVYLEGTQNRLTVQGMILNRTWPDVFSSFYLVHETLL